MDLLSSGFNILLIIIGFGVLIFIHELGHFVAAKWAGIRAEAFAVGMGPVAVAWRKGIGLRFGSTAPEYEKRVREFLSADSGHKIPVPDESGNGDQGLPQAEMYRIGDKLGLGETEYSLRYLPIGGFVKMLGQEDANPEYVSNDPRSYTMCPVGKRMIVVSAGVVMNILLAIVLFIIAFMAGVRFEAPVVGEVSSSLAAGQTAPSNAAELGIHEIGLQPGDVVMQIDGEPARTFADLTIASAMSKPGVPIKLVVRREGVSQPLLFTLRPEKDPASGLLGIGIGPGKSLTLWDKDEGNLVRDMLDELGLSTAGVALGDRLIGVNGQDVQTYEQFQQQVERSNGDPVATEWSRLDEKGEPTGAVVHASVSVEPTYQVLRYAEVLPSDAQNFEQGLLGLTPLVKIAHDPTAQNAGILRKDDVVLRIQNIDAPRMSDFRRQVSANAGKPVSLVVLRNREPVDVTAQVDRKGRLNVLTGYAWELPYVAQPMEQVRGGANPPPAGTGSVEPQTHRTAVAGLELFGRTRIQAVGGVGVDNWSDIRRELRRQTADAHGRKAEAAVELTTILPTPGAEVEAVSLRLSSADVASLHELSWRTDLDSLVFEPIQVTLTAQGNPLTAIAMGFAETKKLVLMTYLTIDRLVRGSVGVDQLRGPVGIIHIGSKVADRGLMYIIFFLGMISVNLAVINFLPMPIVDGGLFLFLIYEKFKGKPPSLAFQNAATMVGLFIIGTLFLVTFYNDVLRLLS